MVGSGAGLVHIVARAHMVGGGAALVRGVGRGSALARRGGRGERYTNTSEYSVGRGMQPLGESRRLYVSHRLAT